MFNYKETLFDCFEQFTGVFFKIASNMPTDSELRVTLLEFYQQVFRGVREYQKATLNNFSAAQLASGVGGSVSASQSFVQSGKRLRNTILMMMESAFFSLHELASVQSKII